MTHKERVIRALNHEETDRPPFQATFTPEFADRLRAEFHLPPMFTEPHHRTWYGYDLEILTGQDALQAGAGWVTNYYLKPDNDEAAMAYKAPDPTRPELYAHLERLVREYGQEYYIIGRVHGTIFETAWALRGLDTLMTDFYLNPELTNHLLDETYLYHKEVVCQMVRRGVDMIWLGDDMGAQASLLIDPDLWREYFKPRMADIIRTAKAMNPQVKIAYHTDGCNYDIILPQGTAEEIRREYQWLKNSIGKNGGWICAPTHHVQLDTPMENFFTLLETIGIEDKRKK